MSARCPTCGSEIDSTDAEIIAHGALPLGGKERAIADVLLTRFGEFVPTTEVISIVYGSQAKANTRKTVNVFCFYARRRLEPVGLTIEGRRGGIKNGGIRIRWAA